MAKKIYLVTSWVDSTYAAEALLAARVLREIPSRKPNHWFFEVCQEGTNYLDTTWWGFQADNNLLVFVGLSPAKNGEELVIHGREGGNRPTDGAVRYGGNFHLLNLPISYEAIASQSLPPILARLAITFFGPDVLGENTWQALKIFADGFDEALKQVEALFITA